MSKKIITVLAPVAAIVAFMAAPSLAQATTQVQCGSSECATNELIRAQSTNVKAQGQNPDSILECESIEFQGSVTSTSGQGEDITGSVTKDVISGCAMETQAGELHNLDITTNASTAAPWTLQVQQPDANGQVTGHLNPASGGNIGLTVKIQELGFTVATCVFSSDTVQLMSTEQEDTIHIEGNEQFTLQSRSGFAAGECGTVHTATQDLIGSFQFETDPTTGNPAAVVAHMTE